MPVSDLWSDNATTRLASAIMTTPAAGTQETCTVAPSTIYQPTSGGFPLASATSGVVRCLIDSEIIVVIIMTGTGNNTWTILRGMEGTATATHGTTALISQVLTAGGEGNLISYADFQASGVLSGMATTITPVQPPPPTLSAPADASTPFTAGTYYVTTSFVSAMESMPSSPSASQVVAASQDLQVDASAGLGVFPPGVQFARIFVGTASSGPFYYQGAQKAAGTPAKLTGTYLTVPAAPTLAAPANTPAFTAGTYYVVTTWKSDPNESDLSPVAGPIAVAAGQALTVNPGTFPSGATNSGGPVTGTHVYIGTSSTGPFWWHGTCDNSASAQYFTGTYLPGGRPAGYINMQPLVRAQAITGTQFGTASTTYYVVTTWVGPNSIESQASGQTPVTVGSGQALSVNAGVFPVGISSANIYVGTVSGGPYYKHGSQAQSNFATTITGAYSTAGVNPPTSSLSINVAAGLAYGTLLGRAAYAGGTVTLVSSQTGAYLDWNGSAFSQNTNSAPATGYARLCKFSTNASAVTAWKDLRPQTSPMGSLGFNPKHPIFGAVGDGVTDDTQAFLQMFAAIDAVQGVRISIPGGIYIINAPLLVPTACVIEGAGALQNSPAGGTILQMGQDSSHGNCHGIVLGPYAQHSHIRDLVLWSHDSGSATFRKTCGVLVQAGFCSLTNITALGFGYDGFLLESTIFPGQADENTLVNCAGKSNGSASAGYGNGIEFRQFDAQVNTVISFDATGNQGFGYMVTCASSNAFVGGQAALNGIGGWFLNNDSSTHVYHPYLEADSGSKVFIGHGSLYGVWYGTSYGAPTTVIIDNSATASWEFITGGKRSLFLMGDRYLRSGQGSVQLDFGNYANNTLCLNVLDSSGNNHNALIATTTQLTSLLAHQFSGHALGGGTAVTGAAGANAGTTPPAPVVANTNDVCGTVTFGTGTTPAAGAQVVLTFAATYGTAPKGISLEAMNSATAALNLYISSISATAMTISSVNAPAASQANTTYSFSYVVLG